MFTPVKLGFRSIAEGLILALLVLLGLWVFFFFPIDSPSSLRVSTAYFHCDDGDLRLCGRIGNSSFRTVAVKTWHGYIDGKCYFDLLGVNRVILWDRIIELDSKAIPAGRDIATCLGINENAIADHLSPGEHTFYVIADGVKSNTVLFRKDETGTLSVIEGVKY